MVLAFSLVLAGCDDPTKESGSTPPVGDPNQVATPTASPAAGAVASGTQIALSTTTAGATIYYTTNGTTPTTSSTTYSAAAKPTITAAVTIKAIAVKGGMISSAVLEAAYTVSAPPVPTGYTVTTIAGSSDGYADATGTAAKFSQPMGIARDSSGNLYVADYTNHRIRKITSGGVVSTLAGDGEGNTNDGTGTTAKINGPYGITIDSAGQNLYVAQNEYIRKVVIASTEVSTLELSEISNPGFQGITMSSAGDLYVASAHSIYKITGLASSPEVLLIAGSNNTTSGNNDGIGTNARFNQPMDIAIGSDGSLYVADTGNNRIRKITFNGEPTAANATVSTFAGSDLGYSDGTGTEAKFRSPSAITRDSAGNFYVADKWNNCIRKITSTGVVTTIAGSGARDLQNNVVSGDADGVGADAQFHYPNGITIDSDGNLYVADTTNHRIRKLTPPAVE